MIYKENFKMGLKDIWKDNEINNKAILEYLENVAGYHSDSVGCGLNSSEQSHLNWILLDWKVKVIKRPKYGQTLEISTWSRKVEKFYAYRDFEVHDEENKLCVIATSKWLLINNQTRKIARVEPEMAAKYESETDKKVFEKELGKLKKPEHFESEIKYKVTRRDIDIIGHMHNIYYLDLAYEALPDEVYAKRPFSKFRIMYKREITLGQVVSLKYTNIGDKHIIVFESDDGNVLHAIVELEN